MFPRPAPTTLNGLGSLVIPPGHHRYGLDRRYGVPFPLSGSPRDKANEDAVAMDLNTIIQTISVYAIPVIFAITLRRASGGFAGF